MCLYLEPRNEIISGMTKLSVNINKIATIRNARGGNLPNVVEAAINIEQYGSQGITVHPRPDERHIRYQDVYDLKKVVTTEFNIEGYPSEQFIDLVLNVKPAQVTLVPDPPDVLTSNNGWDIKAHFDFLKPILEKFQSNGIRVSLFINPEPEVVEYAKKIETGRVELYTESYASIFETGEKEKAIKPFIETAKAVKEAGLGLNAGHDLNLQNLNYFKQQIPWLDEVSIGHALISDALYFGLENTVNLYLRELQ